VCNVAYAVVSFLYIRYTSWGLFSFPPRHKQNIPLCSALFWLGRYTHGDVAMHGHGKHDSEYKESVLLHLTVWFSVIQKKEERLFLKIYAKYGGRFLLYER
jgi:hypothetical protein